MNMERRQAAADTQLRPNDPGCESACRLYGRDKCIGYCAEVGISIHRGSGISPKVLKFRCYMTGFEATCNQLNNSTFWKTLEQH